MENSASAVVEQQQQQQATSQKSKKKSKNRKQTGKCCNSSSPTVDGHHKGAGTVTKNNQKEAAASTAIVENGHSEKLEEQLHVATDGHQMNGIAENSSAHAHNPTHAHAKQNGHHAPAETSNGTCQTQPTAVAEGGKKSKSKSNRPKNKEKVLHCHSDGELVEKLVDEVQSQGHLQAKISSEGTAVATEMTTVATKHLENGFSHDSDNSGAAGSENTENIEPNTAKPNDQIRAANSKTDNCSNMSTTSSQNEENTTNVASTTTAVSPTCQGQSEAAATTAAESTNTQDKTAASANPITAKPNVAAVSAAASAPEATEEQSQISLAPALDLSNVHIEYKEYESELQMHDIMRLIQAELSEPYSIYTYRYFIYNWPKLCFLAAHGNEYVGAIVCKLDMHMNVRRGYIAMLAVRKEYRKLRIGTTLVQKAIEAMLADNADEVVLETEMRNVPALRLYENLGFVRDKRLFRYYLNGVDALRLKLWFR